MTPVKPGAHHAGFFHAPKIIFTIQQFVFGNVICYALHLYRNEKRNT